MLMEFTVGQPNFLRIIDECPVGYVKLFVTIVLTGGRTCPRGALYFVRLLLVNSFTNGQKAGEGGEYIFDYIKLDLRAIGLHIDSLLVEMFKLHNHDTPYWCSCLSMCSVHVRCIEWC
jgi:hypothetical protein